jgi:hypothetical protein
VTTSPRPGSSLAQRPRSFNRLRLIAGVLVLACIGAFPAAQALRRGPASSPDSQLYDLQHDESLGGHTLARHIGRTDQELAERLRREPNISAASTYTDVTAARRTVALAVQQSRGRIESWASRRGSRPNLVLNYTQRDGPPVGRSLFRGERTSRPCDRALVVLRWLEREQVWIVLTSYPETRR